MEVSEFLFAWCQKLGANFGSLKAAQEGWKIRVKYITLSLIENTMARKVTTSPI